MRKATGQSLVAPPPVAPHLSASWNLLSGGLPAVLIDRHGIILAANSKAASILSRTTSELVGQPFGQWVSSLECADLDVVRYADGKYTTRIVHARRLDHLSTGEGTIIALSEKVTVANTPVQDVVRQALIRVHQDHPHLATAITVTSLPEVTVTGESAEVIASWIRFLFHLAGVHRSHLTIRGGLRHGGWVGFDFFLSQSQEVIPAKYRVPRPADQRLLDVRRIGGDFRLFIEDPKIQLDLWIPHQIDSATSI